VKAAIATKNLKATREIVERALQRDSSLTAAFERIGKEQLPIHIVSTHMRRQGEKTYCNRPRQDCRVLHATPILSGRVHNCHICRTKAFFFFWGYSPLGLCPIVDFTCLYTTPQALLPFRPGSLGCFLPPSRCTPSARSRPGSGRRHLPFRNPPIWLLLEYA
jgi:hypothetical protein